MKKFNKKIKNTINSKKIHYVESGDFTYPITKQLIVNGRKNKVLNKKINSKIQVTMIHGRKDEVVPVVYSRRILTLFSKAKKKLIIINNGDHSLSNKKNLKKIIVELQNIVSNVI